VLDCLEYGEIGCLLMRLDLSEGTQVCIDS
jgi:hypothetical protein